MHRAGEALAFLTNHPLADCSGPALELRRAQFSADPVKVARAVVRAKIDASRTEAVLSDEDAGFGARKLLKTGTVDEIMLIEAAMGGIYWRHWYGFELSFSGKAPPEWKRYGTRTRKVSDWHDIGAERCPPWERHSQLRLCCRARECDARIIALGLDPAFGFLHADKSGRLSLSYDAIELLRPKIDRLVDSVYHHVLSWHEALEPEGIPLSVWRIHRKIGMSGGLLTNLLLCEIGIEIDAERIERLRRLHTAAYNRRAADIEPLPGARELLAFLTDADIPWAVATSGRMEMARPALEELRVDYARSGEICEARSRWSQASRASARARLRFPPIRRAAAYGWRVSPMARLIDGACLSDRVLVSEVVRRRLFGCDARSK
jgi:CRISPR associated protein Cas1